MLQPSFPPSFVSKSSKLTSTPRLGNSFSPPTVPSILRPGMAYVHPLQRRIIVPPPAPHLQVDPRTLAFSQVTPAPGTYLPGVLLGNPGLPAVLVSRYVLRINPAFLNRRDEQRTLELIQLMMSKGLVPSSEEEMKRRDAIEQLKQIVVAWIKKVAWRRRLPKEVIACTSATILTYGSYGLGVHGSDSDIDALCLGPSFAILEEDFFIVLHNLLQRRPEVSEIHCVKSAKVPLMRFKFNGICVDFPYAQLQAISVPDNVDMFDTCFVVSDETSWRSLSGVCANRRILQLVPNLKTFQAMLRCIKFWAQRRGLYSHLLGFFGGIHLAILAAHVCQRYPNASISALVAIFFENFSHWQWPEPVILRDSLIPYEYPDGHSFMPIMLPCRPFEWCNSNITRSTFSKIKAEFQRGYSITKDLLRPDFKWNRLFEPFPYTKRYSHFVRILLTAPNVDQLRDWLGWVKSRFRSLLLKLEAVQGYCDPNPTEYVDHNVAEQNIVFYWGLSPNGYYYFNIDSVKEEFMKSVSREDKHTCYHGSGCKLGLSIVASFQLPKNIHFDLADAEGISDYKQHMRPVSAQYGPPYVSAFAASDKEVPGAVG